MNKPLALDLPLQGRQWIEASAGTGKTFTLTLLVLRLLLEREVLLPNILAVTFTKAATQELKIKIRLQIKLAQDLLKQGIPQDLASLDAKQYATACVLHSVLQEKPEKKLQQLLELAIQDCDRASIFTIHGFCTRVLSDHALSAGQVLQAPTLQTSTKALNTKIAFDLWREFNVDRDLMRSLIKLWPNPEALAVDCDKLLLAEPLLPESPQPMPIEFDMHALNQQLCSAIETHLQAAQELLRQAGDKGILNRSSYKPEQLQAFFEKIENWHRSDNKFEFIDPGFAKLGKQNIKTNKAFRDQEPVSALFDTIDQWYEGFEKVQVFERARDMQTLHKVRDRIAQRREAILQKQQQYTYDDLISQVLDALESESGAELAIALRKDYPVALVDEFQDTDSRQWKIFSSLYPKHLPQHTLYLIGDPKQAIYGFRGGDVHAYLAAKCESPAQWNLPENFRSRPQLLGAVATLFEQGGENAFRENDIRFYPVKPGGSVQDADFLWEQKSAPAMHLALLPQYINPKDQKPAALPAGKGRELATRACVEKIHEILLAGQENKAQLVMKEVNPGIEPGDIAVLVNQHSEATQIQQALNDCGIASIISSQDNLFMTFEAQELFIVLDALIKQQDSSRWRGALSTILLGYGAEQILQLDSDDSAATRSADLAVHYRQLWWQQGVLSLVTKLCANAASRILALPDGERRLSNYLQLAEALQQASTLADGPEHCLHWLAQAIQEASNDEENMLRLDSDRKRVKILTLHKSKGLEFPLVFIPFASFGKAHKGRSGLELVNFHQEHQRITYALIGPNNKNEIATVINAQVAEENISEKVRLLYVGLTRAQYYCWVCCGSVYQVDSSGFSSLLFRNNKDEIKTPTHTEFLARLENIHRDNPHILIDELSYQKQLLPRFSDSASSPSILITKPATHIQQDWRVLSFSQLTHSSGHQSPSASAASDEAEQASSLLTVTEEILNKRFAGIAFGNALHHALENTDVQAWAEHDDAGSAPTSEIPLLHQALLRQGYTQEELIAGTQQLAPLIFNTLRVQLPEGPRLCDLPEHARLNEMEFHFSLRECDSHILLSLLKSYGVLQSRDDFTSLRKLSGLMTGKIDLIYLYESRFYVCDYKSNRLTDYDVEQCQQAMRDSEYDFQALIYTLALHRWCKFRLQAYYDYEKQMGGIRYLFCRGLNADNNNGEGIVAMRFEHAFIEKLERLLHPAQEHSI